MKGAGIAFLLGVLVLPSNAQTVGEMPTPIFRGATIEAEATFEKSARTYVYTYTLSNPSSNTGELASFKIDVSADEATNAMVSRTAGLTLQFVARPVPFTEILSRFEKLNARTGMRYRLRAETVVPFGQTVPAGCNGGLSMDSFAGFSCGPNNFVQPGSSRGGFRLISYGVPTVRNAQLEAFWMHIVKDHEQVTPEQARAAGRIEQDLRLHAVTLGASGVAHGSRAHWEQLRTDLARAIQLRWIDDAMLAKELTEQLSSARQALEASDASAARSGLQRLLATLERARGQTRKEGFGLVSLNAWSLLENIDKQKE